jgi:hypothetical protein
MCFTENIAFSLIGILVGYLIGNRLAIGRDKRKEFNEVAIPIHLTLLRQIEILKGGTFIESKVTDDDFRKLGLFFDGSKSIRYANDLKKYKQCIEYSVHLEQGRWKVDFKIDTITNYIKASYIMLSYVKRK